jgi:hypothetical protein
MAGVTLEEMVHSRFNSASPALATAVANYVSPASSEKYSGMPDSKSLEITCFKDSTKFQFGTGLALPGFEHVYADPDSAITPGIAPNMDVGTTWSLVVLLQPILTALGFWRLEWIEGGVPHSAIGVFPTANAIIRGTVRYGCQVSALSRNIWLGVVTTSPTNVEDYFNPKLGNIAGRLRIPAVSMTAHLDAPSLVDQGMVASSLIGQSMAMNGNGNRIDNKVIDGVDGLVTVDARNPFYQWAGPQLGAVTNITSVVQIMANDPTRFVEKPLKEDGSYDIARSATLDWVHGITGMIENPLYSGLIRTIGDVDPLHPTIDSPYTVTGVIDNNIAPMLLAFTNVSQQASLNLRSHVLLEIEPEIGSPFMPFRGLVKHETKITEYFKRFADIAATAAHTFPASANDDGLLANAVKSAMSSAGPVPSSGGGAKGGKAAMISKGIDAGTTAFKAYFDPVSVGHRNKRMSEVKTNKQNNKTERVKAKQMGKTDRKKK